MKKKNSLFLLIVFLIMAVITACSGAPSPASEPEPVQAVAPPPAPQPEPVLSPPQVSEEIILDGAANHKVAKGDTLSSIAANKYGNMFYFPLIRLANTSLISNPDILKMNTNLVIPDLQQNLNNAGAVNMIRTDMLAFAEQYDRRGKPNSAAELRNLAANLSFE